jgi:hypothetical protein
VTLLWAVPALAAVAAVVVVAARARALEQAAADLAGEVRRLRRLRGPLAGIRRATADTDALVEDFRAAHAADEPRNGE